MKNVNCWNDLRAYGIDVLTGEACGLSLRLLCDCTDRGRKLLSKVFGIPQMALAEPWNGGTAQDPHVGSILLPPDLFSLLGVFALLENGCREAWVTKNNAVLGLEPGDMADADHIASVFKDQVARRFAYRGTARDRNVHEMSGRTE